MSFINNLINKIKKYCDDDVCMMIVFIIIGFLLCYLFKDRISGFANLAAPFNEESEMKGLEVNNNDIDISNVPFEQRPIGIVLRPNKPNPTPSTKRSLEVMSQKPPVQKRMINQKNGLLVQDSMIFKPFDEVWNPGFMPLDMVFKNVQKPVGIDRPLGNNQYNPSLGKDRPTGDVVISSDSPSPSGGSELNLVLVYAPWCGHSKRMLPDFERVKSEFDGKTINGKNINIIMYNSDIDKDKVKEYGVTGFPTLFVEKDNNVEKFPHRSYDKISEYLNNI